MNYFHVFWTQPYLRTGTAPAAQDILLLDFELLTWLLSALQARRHGPLRLLTDSRGALAAERAGLTWVYNDGISTPLDAVPVDLDVGVFWAGGKLYAYDQVQAPCVCVDLDAVLWRPLQLVSPLMALHSEGRDWPWYKNNRQDYGRFGFEGDGWNWDLDPFNTAVLYFGNRDIAAQYASTARAFVERYSREVCWDGVPRPQCNDTMLFAEQRLLPMCAARAGLEVAPVVREPPLATCLPHNPECLHLWRAKLAYRVCTEARLALVNWLIELLLKEFPESRPVLARWDLDHEQRGVKSQEPDLKIFEELHRSDIRFSLLKNVQGDISIEDLTTGISRRASEGCMVWSGEIIHPEPSARFKLEVIGSQALTIHALA